MDAMASPLSAHFDLNHFLKTAQGRQLLDTHKPFIAKGEVLQGYQGACFEVRESQLKDSELKEMADLDGSKDQVWVKRKQRLESSHSRKAEEYSERRGQLRGRQNEIFEAAERRERLGFPTSAADQQEIEEIDTRMGRLAALKEQHGMEVATKALEPPPSRTEALCGEISPESHQNHEKWRMGHQANCPKCREVRKGTA